MNWIYVAYVGLSVMVACQILLLILQIIDLIRLRKENKEKKKKEMKHGG